jgi:hypothetical protein
VAIKFETVKAGDVLYDYHSEQAGNTTMRRWGNWTVRVIEVNYEKRTALVSWNGNPPRKYYERQICRLRRSPGKVRDPLGSMFAYARAAAK